MEFTIFDKNVLFFILTINLRQKETLGGVVGGGTNKSNYWATDVVETNAYIGLQSSCILKSNCKGMKSLFSKDYGRPIF